MPRRLLLFRETAVLRRLNVRLTFVPVLIAIAGGSLVAAESSPESFASLADQYKTKAHPVLKQFCLGCHSTEKQKGELDLERFASLADVRRDTKSWLKVVEMLDSGEMPPKESKQPNAEQRKELRGWIERYLHAESLANAGDPGPVVLRRLSNAEYTHTLRDLTGIAGLDPAREFPVDGAAGEGFTNTGSALVMSPALLTKYLDAAKEVAAHAVLLPDGIRFSPATTPRDWTDETLARIRDFYRRFSDAGGGDKVNLQGIVFDTNTGGRLAVESYLAATVIEREALATGRKTIDEVARERSLNVRYLGTLWRSLSAKDDSLLLNGLRARWRAAKTDDVAALASDVAAWQKGLWRFATVGHIGKVGGPKRWLEPVSPVTARQDVRFKIPTVPEGQDVTIALVASDAGDGSDHDFVVWHQPRLVGPGRPELLLRDVRAVVHDLTRQRDQIFARAATYLIAADEAAAKQGEADVDALAKKHVLDANALRAWLDYLGIGAGGPVELQGHFTATIPSAAGYDFIKGWGSHQTPLLVANSSDQHVRIPGNMKPHSVAVHPSPTLRVAVGWQSPVTATLRIEGTVTHAHPECGNGVTWLLELRRGATRRRLANGIAQGAKAVAVGPVEGLVIQKGDLVSLLIGPRDGNHSCDLTAIDIKLTRAGEQARTWDLAADVSGNVHAGNPHADRFGNEDIWHFYVEPEKGTETSPVIPADSLLTRWSDAKNSADRRKLADDVQKLLTSPTSPPADRPDDVLYRQLVSLGGPLLSGALARSAGEKTSPQQTDNAKVSPGHTSDYGLDPATFGKHPNGKPIDRGSLCVKAPAVVEIRLPADLVAGCELVTTGMLDSETGAEGSVQLQVLAGKPGREAGLLPSEVTTTFASGQWTADNRRTSFGSPILVNEGTAARKRVEAAFDDFRSLFPAALCYTKIVPVDEVVTLTLFYREDDHLARLMLDDSQRAALDKLWDELHYISHDAVTLVDALEQLIQYATQDADPKVFEPLRKPFADRADSFRQRLIDTEPKHLAALLDFASRAYRRPLTDSEARELRTLYADLRAQEIPHDEAFRLTLARVLVAAPFLYRIEVPGPGAGPTPVSDWELASRLSYFLSSSGPDDELRRQAEAGRLRDPVTLTAQTRRMLRDERTRRLAIEFACQWLHIHDFDHLDEKSERHFPTFAGLRGAMYEESIRFFTDLFQNNGSVLDILDADYTFVNKDLAKHYGLPVGQAFQPDSSPGSRGRDSQPGKPDLQFGWQRIDGAKNFGRGGILGQATTLASQSGASRTSPILRGNWISEVLLGEKLPRPPKGVPQLPDDEAATEGKTVRQLVEQHSSDARCAVCHQRIDPFGFALEGFDAIGRRRERDLGDRPINVRVKTLDGAEFEGLDGLRNYLVSTRRESFLRQFCRKLLGYALGRSVQLSDEPLLTEMQAALKANEYRVIVAVEAIVRSRQFREIRGRDAVSAD